MMGTNLLHTSPGPGATPAGFPLRRNDYPPSPGSERRLVSVSWCYHRIPGWLRVLIAPPTGWGVYGPGICTKQGSPCCSISWQAKVSERTEEMAQQVKPLPDKSNVLHLIPGLHVVECETGSVYTHTHTHNLREGEGREEERGRIQGTG